MAGGSYKVEWWDQMLKWRTPLICWYNFFFQKFTLGKFWLSKVTFFCFESQIWKWKSVLKGRLRGHFHESRISEMKVRTERMWIWFPAFTPRKSRKSYFYHESKIREFEPCIFVCIYFMCKKYTIFLLLKRCIVSFCFAVQHHMECWLLDNVCFFNKCFFLYAHK